ncbi:MAG TPA: 4Fe-4S dicluster domain-containing protein [Armatimonadota bacterium]
MSITRRGLLAGLGTGLAAISAPRGYEKLIPFVYPPEDLVPGEATWYASSCRECPAGCGVVLRNREARVVKVEGNPLHSISRGRLCARGQAALQGLYDPDRVPGPRRRGPQRAWEAASWDEALGAVGRVLSGTRRVGIITDLQTGSLHALMEAWLKALRRTTGSVSDSLLVYEPLNYESLRHANGAATGRPWIPDYRIDQCDLLVSFGADFLETWLSPVELTRRFHQMRRVRNGRRSRFVYVGPRLSATASQADEVILLPPPAERAFAAVLEALLRKATPPDAQVSALAARGVDPGAVQRLADGLLAARAPLALGGSPLLGAGAPEGSPALLAARVNQATRTAAVDFGRRAHALGACATQNEVFAFLDHLRAGALDVLLVLNANPLYSLPVDPQRDRLLEVVPTIVSLTPFLDETAEAAAHWLLPTNTPVESWGDFAPQAGVLNLMQPAMGPLFDTRQAGDVLIQLARAAGIGVQAAFGAESYYDYLRSRWASLHAGLSRPEERATRPAGPADERFEAFWRRSVQQGGIEREVLPEGYVFPLRPETGPEPGDVAAARGPLRDRSAPATRTDEGTVALHLYPSPLLLDGRHANKRWLQEVPDALTGAVWGSWIEVGPETASRLGLTAGALAEVRGAQVLQVPVHVREGLAADTAALALGQGHTALGRYAKDQGVNAFLLVRTGPDGRLAGVTLRPLVGDSGHVVVHGEHRQHGREVLQTVGLAHLEGLKADAVDLPLPEGYHQERDVYPAHEHGAYRWAMAVDLNRCTGCNACVVACYAENNIPVVGKRQVARRHELPWLRIDRYEEEGRVLFQPMMCHHCDSAPCETVCPVYAAVHGEEGLNEQIYNRCVGTRYCSNNCPYKVRRFNWFHFEWPEPLNVQLNPDVTVRDRGVMEKCTFCVQRIKEVTIKAKAEMRAVRDGDITPACAQTCPSEVFVFGDLSDPGSRVATLVAQDPRRYQVLRELNTKPAVFYLKRVVEEREA